MNSQDYIYIHIHDDASRGLVIYIRVLIYYHTSGCLLSYIRVLIHIHPGTYVGGGEVSDAIARAQQLLASVKKSAGRKSYEVLWAAADTARLLGTSTLHIPPQHRLFHCTLFYIYRNIETATKTKLFENQRKKVFFWGATISKKQFSFCHSFSVFL